MIRSASRTRAPSFGLMPMPTSPAYCGCRLSKVSWKRKRSRPAVASSRRNAAAQARLGIPAAAAGDHQRPPGRQQHRAHVAQRARRRPGRRRLAPAAAPARRCAWSACPRAAPAPPAPAGPAARCGRRAPRTRARGPRLSICADPLGHAERARAEHLPVVDFLERLAVALVAGHLADEQDHRRASPGTRCARRCWRWWRPGRA